MNWLGLLPVCWTSVVTVDCNCFSSTNYYSATSVSQELNIINVWTFLLKSNWLTYVYIGHGETVQ